MLPFMIIIKKNKTKHLHLCKIVIKKMYQEKIVCRFLARDFVTKMAFLMSLG